MADDVRELRDVPTRHGDVPALLSRHPIYLFDGVCRLCDGFVGFLLRRDRGGEIRFVQVQSDLGQRILAHLGLSLTDWDSHVYVEHGRVFLKSDGFFQVLRRLPPPWPWIGCFGILPRFLRDWVYDRVARNRYTLFGRYRVCMRPPPDAADRFLE